MHKIFQFNAYPTWSNQHPSEESSLIGCGAPQMSFISRCRGMHSPRLVPPHVSVLGSPSHLRLQNPPLGFLGRMWTTFHKHIHARFKTSPLLRGSQGKWIAKHGMAEELMTRYYSYYAKVLFLSTYFILICILPLGKDKWKLRITGSCLVPGTRRRITSGDYPPSCLVNKYTHYRQRNACWLLAKSWLFIIVV